MEGGSIYRVEILGSGAAPVAGTSYDQTTLTGGGVELGLDSTPTTGSILELAVAGTLRASGIASDSKILTM